MITVKPIVTQRKKSFFDLDNSSNFDNLDTGDLVFVAYENTLGYFMRGYMGSAWTHVGMIMRYKDELYVLETADYRSVRVPVKSPIKSYNNSGIEHTTWKYAKNNGIMVLPFENWKSLNKNHTITFKKLQTPKHWDKVILVKEFLKIQEENLDTFEVGSCNFRLWSKFIWRSKYKNRLNKKSNITCSEMIARIYQKSGVLKKIYEPSSYYTNDFIDGNIELEQGFKLI
jgi:hypothetical protein